MENTSVKDLLRDHLDVKGLTIKKVADLTGIPEKYIDALLEGNDRLLPPAPYVRGYLTKLANLLDIDKNEIWNLYQKESSLNRSGHTDRLPSNRFAIRSINKKWLIAGLVIIFAGLYLTTNIYEILQPPEITIISPETENALVTESEIAITGTTDPANKLTINGVEVYVNKDGKFTKEQLLQPGLNSIEIVVKKFLGKEARVLRQIIYQPSSNENSTSTPLLIEE